MVSFFAPTSSHAGTEIKRNKGQTVYVPVYSHIYSGDRERPFYLAATLSIRNTDPTETIMVVSANYYDSNGKLVEKYIGDNIKLNPLSSARFVVKESDVRGGSGACFVVKWKSQKKVSTPVIETIMISTKSQQGISFVSRGHVIEEIND